MGWAARVKGDVRVRPAGDRRGGQPAGGAPRRYPVRNRPLFGWLDDREDRIAMMALLCLSRYYPIRQTSGRDEPRDNAVQD